MKQKCELSALLAKIPPKIILYLLKQILKSLNKVKVSPSVFASLSENIYWLLKFSRAGVLILMIEVIAPNP
jgi:hypothetical protein